MRSLLPFRRLFFVLLLAGVFSCAATVPSSTAQAQQRGPVQRVVSGKVIDQSNNPLTNAVVYLKDTRTTGIKSFIVQQDGGYRFGQLASDTDYQVWAESSGKKSAVKTISSFDSSRQFIIDLKVNISK